MKKVVFVLLLIVLLSFIVAAVDNSVIVVKVHYEYDKLNIVDSTIKAGNFPDRKVQPEDGYKLEIISDTNSVLYSIKFLVPNKRFVDSGNADGTITGGVVVLSETDFALILPFFDDAQEIRISSPVNNVIKESYSIKTNEMFGPTVGRIGLIALIVGAFLIAGFFAWRYFRNRYSISAEN